MLHGFVRQEATTMRYAAGSQSVSFRDRLRERVRRRSRFCPDDLRRLRDETSSRRPLSAWLNIGRGLGGPQCHGSSISERNPEPCSIFMRLPERRVGVSAPEAHGVCLAKTAQGVPPLACFPRIPLPSPQFRTVPVGKIGNE